ncbi:MAG: FGGY-family carbohydrate kinase [Acidimicrobiia bacterium]|nr:FGGY-family carbohydrate kinase [Acidimicrobiia bacterium]
MPLRGERAAPGVSRVLVLDTGSKTVRAACVEDGLLVTSASVPHVLVEPADAFAGKEWDPQQLWQDTCRAIREACADVPPDVVVASTQRLAVVLLDSAGHALYAGPNSDARGLLEAVELMRAHEPHMSAVTGHRPPIVLVPPRIAWMRKHRPALADSIRTVLSLADWYAYRLTRELCAEPTLAGASGLLDVSTARWAADVAAWGVDPAWLPDLRRPGDLLGPVTDEAEGETGIPAGTPVAVGCADTMAGLLGMGTVDAGAVGVVAGSTLPVMAVHSAPPQDPSNRCWRGCHAPRDRFVLEVNGGEAGIAQAWLAALLGVSPEDLHVLAAEAAPAELPPAILGPAPMDFSDMPLAIQGELRVPLPVGVLGPGKPGVARAFVENLAYAVGRARDWLDADGIASLDLGGGLSESGLLPTVLASVLGIPVRHHGIGVTTRGAALCGEAALGRISDLAEAGRDLGAAAPSVDPDPAWIDTYAAGYTAWVQAHDRALANAIRISAMT